MLKVLYTNHILYNGIKLNQCSDKNTFASNKSFKLTNAVSHTKL